MKLIAPLAEQEAQRVPAPDLEAPVGGADPVDGRRQPGLDLSPGAAPIPALERSAQSRAIGAATAT